MNNSERQFEIKPSLAATIVGFVFCFFGGLFLFLLIPIIGWVIGLIGMGFGVWLLLNSGSNYTFYNDRVIAQTFTGINQVKYSDIDFIKISNTLGARSYTIFSKGNKNITPPNEKMDEIIEFLEKKAKIKSVN